MSETLRVTGATTPADRSAFDANVTDYGDFEFDIAQKGEDTLAALQRLAQELLNYQREVTHAETALKDLQARLAAVQEKALPELMMRHNLPRFEFIDTTTGLTQVIEYEEKFRVTMPGADHVEERKRIFAWLREVGQSGIIAKDVVVPVGMRADDFVSEIMGAIKERYPNLDPGLKEGVHPSRLKAAVRRLIEKGKDICPDINVQTIQQASVTLK